MPLRGDKRSSSKVRLGTGKRPRGDDGYAQVLALGLAILMTATIFDAVKTAGVRALVSAGWGGLGDVEPPAEVFILKGASSSLSHADQKATYRTTGCSPTAESRLYATTEVSHFTALVRC